MGRPILLHQVSQQAESLALEPQAAPLADRHRQQRLQRVQAAGLVKG